MVGDIKVEQWLFEFTSISREQTKYGKWFVSKEVDVEDDETIDNHLYLWPDGSWKPYADTPFLGDAYYNSEEEARAVLTRAEGKS